MLEFDLRDLVDIGEVYERAGRQGPKIVSRAMNQRLNVSYTAVARTTAKETGLPVGETKKAMRKDRASPSDLTISIRARGGFLSLKRFAARQVRKGVSHKAWNRRQVNKGAFIVGKMGGHVFTRTTDKRFPLRKEYGPSIPNEMVKGESFGAMMKAFGDGFADRVMHELGRVIGRK